ncbi:zinc-binding dehydrogenase [Paraburkholderia silvatlantica]|uniref:NADPH:quinone reductase-like Zn-dependent oxidoreductase n=1 Tax=Paraburkholderia silvatlantica TaxID=321895 RepID=A0ABR6FKP1_9BURK|nr:zinc-binding dehydrogenase [Paraburkholderia silvatlantica]MBB2928002.1 NADPH:quinone reductase-like Zn-dependent oxidoreductase [Paraburkholderia silvatlantica]PVY17625.1 NADPH:quinone reductase-like Zn-dependent oxidoreductase [Paraburkholderia silvatlantica]PXW23537.1 NADPH:quinone reductase-like Zn-dependent oxidoreductase [Paraburkholderia silvatlantica]
MPHSHRAWIWTPGAGLDGLQLIRKPLSQPGPGQVLVANRAIALNPVDWKICELGHSDWHQGTVPGVDGAGTIASIGEDVDLRLGTRVAYHQSLSRDGSFAEYSLLDASLLMHLPGNLEYAAAAAVPCPALTAWQALAKVAVGASTDVLVTGAGGAVGFYLAQLAVQRGLRVWATAGEKHHARLKQLGVVKVFDYQASDWPARLQAALGDRPLHALFDTVSAAHASNLAPLLGYNGHLVCIQDRQETAPLAAFSTAISLHEVALNSIHTRGRLLDRQALKVDGEILLQMVADGRLLAPERLNFVFEALPEALRQLKDGSSSGKWVTSLD